MKCPQVFLMVLLAAAYVWSGSSFAQAKKVKYELTNPACKYIYDRHHETFMRGWNQIYKEADVITKRNVAFLQKFEKEISADELRKMQSFVGRKGAREAINDFMLRKKILAFSSNFHRAFCDEESDQETTSGYCVGAGEPYIAKQTQDFWTYSDGKIFGVMACGMIRIDDPKDYADGSPALELPNPFSSSETYTTEFDKQGDALAWRNLSYVPAVSCITLDFSTGRPMLVRGDTYHAMHHPYAREYLKKKFPRLLTAKEITERFEHLEGLDVHLERHMPKECILSEKPSNLSQPVEEEDLGVKTPTSYAGASDGGTSDAGTKAEIK